MAKFSKVDWDKFKALAKKLIIYKSKFSYTPIRAENWEEVLYVVFVHMFKREKIFWDPVSHAKGIDLTIKLNGDTLSISAKGGKIVNNKLSISSYRLTRYKTLREKLEFLKHNAKDIDFYLVCSREERAGNVDYKIFKINGVSLTPPILLKTNSWVEHRGVWEFIKSSNVGFEARIVKSMSHQLWYSIFLPNTRLELLCDVSLSKKAIGQLLHGILEDKS